MIERRSRKLMVAITPTLYNGLAHKSRIEGESMAVIVRRAILKEIGGMQSQPNANQPQPEPARGMYHAQPA